MDDRSHPDAADLLFGKMHFLGDRTGKLHDALLVAGGVRIPFLDRGRQCGDRIFQQAFEILIIMVHEVPQGDHAPDEPVLHDGHMPDLVHLHGLHDVDIGVIDVGHLQVPGHKVFNLRVGKAFEVAEVDLFKDVPLGEDADGVAVLHDKDGADRFYFHELNGLEHGLFAVDADQGGSHVIRNGFHSARPFLYRFVSIRCA